MALTLQEIGVPARSWQGWQVPLRTNSSHGAARIVGIETEALERKFGEGLHAVIAGFQGLGPEGRITTLGRGGSDTSAVAFAAALGAERCDIYTDVDGVYTTDPRITRKARKLDKIAYEEMLEMASLGAKVLQTRSVELAMRYKVRLQVLSSFSDVPGTHRLRRGGNHGIACRQRRRLFARRGQAHGHRACPTGPGIAAALFGPLAEAGVNVDMIVQNIGADGRTDMTFSCPVDEVPRARHAIEASRAAGALDFAGLDVDEEVAKVSIVGIGMRSQAGVAHRMFEALARGRGQHQGHHHLRDQGLGADRPQISGTRGAGTT